MPAPNELPPQVKIFIVQQLACFERPQAVAKAVKDEFGKDVSRQRVHYYDPTSKLGASLAPELKELFHSTRKTFLEQVDTIPIANKAVQLRALDRQLAKAEASPGAHALVIPIIEAAAKIAGTLTNKHEHKHSGRIDSDVTDDEIDARIRATFEEIAALGLTPGAGDEAGRAAGGKTAPDQPQSAEKPLP